MRSGGDRAGRGRFLAVLAASVGVGIGLVLILASAVFFGPGGRSYWSDSVDVPTTAQSSNPDVVVFHGATFSMWWPPLGPPNAPSSGLPGITIQITEPSGATAQVYTGCGACSSQTHYWYSSDGSVGVSYRDTPSEDVTLLVST